MSEGREKTAVLKLADGIRFAAGPDHWSTSPLTVPLGSWIALVPEVLEPVVDPSGPLAWILATMQEPVRGTVELFGEDVYRLGMNARQRLRANIGFVHGYGGLLSALSVRQNIALPVSVHRRLSAAEEAAVVEKILHRFALEKVADLRPHEMDGSMRWRACLARALGLDPEWLVVEGIGNWEMDRGRSTDWKRLVETQQKGASAMAVCLARRNPAFEAWFEAHGGSIVSFGRTRNNEQGMENP